MLAYLQMGPEVDLAVFNTTQQRTQVDTGLCSTHDEGAVSGRRTIPFQHKGCDGEEVGTMVFRVCIGLC